MGKQVSPLLWDDEVGRIIVRGSGANDPNWTQVNATNFWAYSFSATTMQQFWITFHVRHGYAPGTVMYPHVHWFNPAASPNTGVVRWGFEWAVAAGYNTAAFPFGSSTTKYVETASSATQYQHMISEVVLADAIPATETDALVCMRIFRDAANVADTCTDAVMVPLVDLHYQRDDGTGTIGRNTVGAWSKI